MSGWAAVISAVCALAGVLAGLWATVRKRAEEHAALRTQLAGLLTLTEEIRQEQRRQAEQLTARPAPCWSRPPPPSPSGPDGAFPQ